jgi:transcriptional regulator with XRE-family HTH domain
MKTLKVLKAELLANPKVRKAYDELAPEYEIARAVIRARALAGLTQVQLAERMGTSQSYVARLESGRTLPSTRTLLKVAEITGTRPRFTLDSPPRRAAAARAKDDRLECGPAPRR